MKNNILCNSNDSIKDLMKCNYTISETDFLVIDNLLKNEKGLSVIDLVKIINRDRTTIQKVMIKLLEKELCYKRQINLDRGFMFIYFAKDKIKLISEIEKSLDSQFKELKNKLKNWGNE